MTDLLEETHSDFQYERNLKLFKKILPIVIAATIFFIIIISAKNWYNARKNEKLESRTELLVKTLLMNDDSKKVAMLNTISTENDDIGNYAKLEASITGNISSEEVEELEKIASNSSNKIVSSLAKLRFVGISLDKSDLLEKNKQKIQTFLVSFTKSEPLYLNAKILEILYNIQIKNITSAKEILSRLNIEPNLPETIKGQIEAIENHIKNKEKNEK